MENLKGKKPRDNNVENLKGKRPREPTYSKLNNYVKRNTQETVGNNLELVFVLLMITHTLCVYIKKIIIIC